MKNIRLYGEGDREQVLALWRECNLVRPKNNPNKDLDRKRGFGEELFLVLEEEEKVIGCLLYTSPSPRD